MKKFYLFITILICVLSPNLSAQFSIDVFGGALFNGSSKSYKGGIGPILGLTPTYSFNKKWSIKNSIYIISEVINEQYIFPIRGEDHEKIITNLFSFSPSLEYNINQNLSCSAGYFFRHVYHNNFHLTFLSSSNYNLKTDNGLSFQIRYKRYEYFGFLKCNIGLGRNVQAAIVERTEGLEVGIGYTFSNLMN